VTPLPSGTRRREQAGFSRMLFLLFLFLLLFLGFDVEGALEGDRGWRGRHRVADPEDYEEHEVGCSEYREPVGPFGVVGEPGEGGAEPGREGPYEVADHYQDRCGHDRVAEGLVVQLGSLILVMWDPY